MNNKELGGGSYGEISGGELEGAELEESGTKLLYSGDMSGGYGDGKIEVSPMGEKLFGS